MREKTVIRSLDDVDVIPSEWIALVGGRRFTEADFRLHMRLRRDDPSNFLYGITLKGDLIGFIWAEYNALESALFVNTVVIDPSFRKDANILKEVIVFLKEAVILLEVRSLLISSPHSKIFIKEGCRAHPETLWIYDNPHKDAHSVKHLLTRKERLSLKAGREL